ncbi:MAG: GYD domain-containing protein [Chloroflexota bacterium]
MPYYLAQASYTHDAWAALLKNPQNRTEGVRTLIGGMGGTFHGLYYAFGEHDIVLLFEAPDNQAAAAVSLSLGAPGHLKDFKTTVLLTPEELTTVLAKAGAQTYQAPR